MGRQVFILECSRNEENTIFMAPKNNWTVSSVGLEHYFDRVGATGSSPVQSTKKQMPDLLF